VRAAAIDGKFILGSHIGDYEVPGELELLRAIYRVTDATERRGIAAMQKAMKAAYDKTQDAIRTHPDLDRLFRPTFVERLADWDDAVRCWLGARRNGWQEHVAALLRSRGYDESLTENYVQAIERQERFLTWLSFLFQS
jgi:hypothetical protein